MRSAFARKPASAQRAPRRIDAQIRMHPQVGVSRADWLDQSAPNGMTAKAARRERAKCKGRLLPIQEQNSLLRPCAREAGNRACAGCISSRARAIFLGSEPRIRALCRRFDRATSTSWSAAVGERCIEPRGVILQSPAVILQSPADNAVERSASAYASRGHRSSGGDPNRANSFSYGAPSERWPRLRGESLPLEISILTS